MSRIKFSLHIWKTLKFWIMLWLPTQNTRLQFLSKFTLSLIQFEYLQFQFHLLLMKHWGLAAKNYYLLYATFYIPLQNEYFHDLILQVFFLLQQENFISILWLILIRFLLTLFRFTFSTHLWVIFLMRTQIEFEE